MRINALNPHCLLMRRCNSHCLVTFVLFLFLWSVLISGLFFFLKHVLFCFCLSICFFLVSSFLFSVFLSFSQFFLSLCVIFPFFLLLTSLFLFSFFVLCFILYLYVYVSICTYIYTLPFFSFMFSSPLLARALSYLTLFSFA